MRPSVDVANAGQFNWNLITSIVWCAGRRCWCLIFSSRLTTFTVYCFCPPASLFLNAALFTRSSAGWLCSVLTPGWPLCISSEGKKIEQPIPVGSLRIRWKFTRLSACLPLSVPGRRPLQFERVLLIPPSCWAEFICSVRPLRKQSLSISWAEPPLKLPFDESQPQASAVTLGDSTIFGTKWIFHSAHRFPSKTVNMTCNVFDKYASAWSTEFALKTFTSTTVCIWNNAQQAPISHLHL